LLDPAVEGTAILYNTGNCYHSEAAYLCYCLFHRMLQSCLSLMALLYLMKCSHFFHRFYRTSWRDLLKFQRQFCSLGLFHLTSLC